MPTTPKRLTGTPDSRSKRQRVLRGSIHAVEDREKVVVVRLSAEERAAVKLEAWRAGLEQASWVRMAIRAQLSPSVVAQAKRLVHQPKPLTSTDPDVTRL